MRLNAPLGWFSMLCLSTALLPAQSTNPLDHLHLQHCAQPLAQRMGLLTGLAILSIPGGFLLLVAAIARLQHSG